jgi:hypothetical protein
MSCCCDKLLTIYTKVARCTNTVKATCVLVSDTIARIETRINSARIMCRKSCEMSCSWKYFTSSACVSNLTGTDVFGVCARVGIA